jgi:hypothetical protein
MQVALVVLTLFLVVLPQLVEVVEQIMVGRLLLADQVVVAVVPQIKVVGQALLVKAILVVLVHQILALVKLVVEAVAQVLLVRLELSIMRVVVVALAFAQQSQAKEFFMLAEAVQVVT